MVYVATKYICVKVYGEKMGGKRGRLFLFFDLGDIYDTRSLFVSRSGLFRLLDGRDCVGLASTYPFSLFFFCIFLESASTVLNLGPREPRAKVSSISFYIPHFHQKEYQKVKRKGKENNKNSNQNEDVVSILKIYILLPTLFHITNKRSLCGAIN